MALLECDPDELDQGAHALRRSRDALVNEAKNLRSAVGKMGRFRGREAERFRLEMEGLAREITKRADELGRQADSLRSFAEDVRQLRRS